jgi:hypothetical protein
MNESKNVLESKADYVANTGTFLMECLPKIYHTPKSVLDYINKWKNVIGNVPWQKPTRS